MAHSKRVGSASAAWAGMQRRTVVVPFSDSRTRCRSRESLITDANRRVRNHAAVQLANISSSNATKKGDLGLDQ